MKKVYLLAVLAAVLFGTLMYLYLQGTTSASATSVEMKTVVVATCDIAPGTTITEDMVEERQVAASAVQVNAVSSAKQAINKCCPAQIVKGEQLLSNMLDDSGTTGVRLSAQLEDDMYAMTIMVETDAGVGGYVKAGDHVDLLGLELDADGYAVSSYAIVEDVEVLRVNEATEEGQTPYDYMTLSLTEEQCETVYMYQALEPSQGSTYDLHVILRSSQSGGAQ